MTAVDLVQAMLDAELSTIERCSKEVTADYESVVAEHRAACLRDVIRNMKGGVDV